MTQAVMTKSSFVDDKAHKNKVLTEENQKNLFDITTGKALTDVKQKKIKVSAEEQQAIALLQQHYGAKLGRDITLSELIRLLVYKQLEDTFSLDFTALKTALNAGLSVKIPNISVGFTAPVLGVSQDD